LNVSSLLSTLYRTVARVWRGKRGWIGNKPCKSEAETMIDASRYSSRGEEGLGTLAGRATRRKPNRCRTSSSSKM
jgi:hypothetical protein